MVYPSPLRRRRRRRLFWLIGASAVVVLIAVLVVQLRTERRRVGDYLEVANSAAQTYKELAGDVELIITDLEARERPRVLETLREAVAAADEADAAVRAAEPPSGAGALSGYFTASSGSWRDGLALLESTIAALLDQPDDFARQALLETVFLDFRVGDRAYQRFLEAVDGMEDDLVTFTFPEISFVAPDKEIAYDAGAFAERIQALAALSARHDIAVADISFLPQPVGDEQGVPVIPASDDFEAQVTLVNRGNEPEGELELELLLLRLEGGTSVATESRTIEPLGPGDALTIGFPDLPVEQGIMYELVARAPLDFDADPASNELRKVFIWNGSS